MISGERGFVPTHEPPHFGPPSSVKVNFHNVRTPLWLAIRGKLIYLESIRKCNIARAKVISGGRHLVHPPNPSFGPNLPLKIPIRNREEGVSKEGFKGRTEGRPPEITLSRSFLASRYSNLSRVGQPVGGLRHLKSASVIGND